MNFRAHKDLNFQTVSHAIHTKNCRPEQGSVIPPKMHEAKRCTHGTSLTSVMTRQFLLSNRKGSSNSSSLFERDVEEVGWNSWVALQLTKFCTVPRTAQVRVPELDSRLQPLMSTPHRQNLGDSTDALHNWIPASHPARHELCFQLPTLVNPGQGHCRYVKIKVTD